MAVVAGAAFIAARLVAFRVPDHSRGASGHPALAGRVPYSTSKLGSTSLHRQVRLLDELVAIFEGVVTK